MSKFPRILAVTGVALGGVLAVNAVAGARGLPNLFSAAKAMAEASPAKAAAKPKDVALASAADAAAVTAAAAPPPVVCAPDAAELAKMANLSPGELAVLQSLKDREADLMSRESQGDLGAQLMDAAGKKVDAKLAALQDLKAQIDALLKQAQAAQDAETARMVTTYSAMKPKNAAQALAIMSDDVRLPIAAGMKESKLALVLAAMTPAQATDLTQKLTQRFADQAKTAQAALASGAPAAAAPAAAPAAAGQAAAKPATPAAATPAPAKAAAATPAAPAKAG